MSRWDYDMSKKLTGSGASFDSLIMAAIRKADTINTELLKAAFPRVYQEFHDRYHAPGGVLPDDTEGTNR